MDDVPPLPEELQAEIIAAGDRAAASYRSLEMPVRNVDILGFIRVKEPDLYRRFIFSTSPEVRRRFELVQERAKNTAKNLEVIYAIAGAEAFAGKLQVLKDRIADHTGEEFERQMLELEALEMQSILLKPFITKKRGPRNGA